MLTEIIYFYKNNYIVQNKKSDSFLKYFLQVSSMSSLIEDSWIFITASAFGMLQSIVLVEIY